MNIENIYVISKALLQMSKDLEAVEPLSSDMLLSVSRHLGGQLVKNAPAEVLKTVSVKSDKVAPEPEVESACGDCSDCRDEKYANTQDNTGEIHDSSDCEIYCDCQSQTENSGDVELPMKREKPSPMSKPLTEEAEVNDKIKSIISEIRQELDI